MPKQRERQAVHLSMIRGGWRFTYGAVRPGSCPDDIGESMIPSDLLARFTLNEIRELCAAYLSGFSEASRFFSIFQEAVSRPNEFDKVNECLVMRGISAIAERVHGFSLVEQRIVGAKGGIAVDSFSRLTTFVSAGPLLWAERNYPSAHCVAATATMCTMQICDSVIQDSAKGISAAVTLCKWPGMTRCCNPVEISAIRSRLALEAAEIEKIYANAEMPSFALTDQAKTADAPGKGADGKRDQDDNNSSMSGEARALAVLTEHPDWSDTRIAKEAGISRTTLYDYSKFKNIRAMQGQGRANIRRGQKSKDGDIEVWEDE